MDCDVAIIGAGVAGLAAAGVLAQGGLSVRCLEAHPFAGGRIRTVRDPLDSFPVELGAEFVHGLPPETWQIIQRAGLKVVEHSGKHLYLDQGRVPPESAGDMADKVFDAAGKSRRRGDESFAEFLRRARHPTRAKLRAAQQVEGFDAADQERISLKSLQLEWEASDKIDGDRAFRVMDGYDSVVQSLMHSIPDWRAVVQCNSVVERVKWRKGHVRVEYRSTLDDSRQELTCRQLIVTVSLGVLQAAASSIGAIEFDPAPVSALKRRAHLILGQAFRVTFRFREAFWEGGPAVPASRLSLFRRESVSDLVDDLSGTAPILTGWTAGSATGFLMEGGRPRSIQREALTSLERMLGRPIPKPFAAHFHDWSTDPFFRGAYSYVPTHALRARSALAQPVQNTLFFSGEATETTGNAGYSTWSDRERYRSSGQGKKHSLKPFV